MAHQTKAKSDPLKAGKPSLHSKKNQCKIQQNGNQKLVKIKMKMKMKLKIKKKNEIDKNNEMDIDKDVE